MPHFEKMLYDNALFVRLYLHAWQLTGKERYLQVVDETIDYVLRDLRHDDGGFFRAEDADSEGEEGKFYLWTPPRSRRCSATMPSSSAAWYGVTDEGNFEGRNILWRPVRGDLLRPVGVELSRQRLYAARELRDPARTRRQGPDRVERSHVWRVWPRRRGHRRTTVARQPLDATASSSCANLRRTDGRWLRSWHAVT